MHNQDLKKAGLKITGPRIKILQILESNKSNLTKLKSSSDNNNSINFIKSHHDSSNYKQSSEALKINLHMSAEDIYKILIEMGEDVGIATVYRVLTQFESAGLVIRHRFEGDQSVYELNDGEHHDHLVCIKCGKVQEFVDPIIEERQLAIAQKMNFKMTDHTLYIFGFCNFCNNNN